MNLILPNDTLRLGPKRLFTVIATIAAKDTEDHQPRIVVIERDIRTRCLRYGSGLTSKDG